MRLTDQYRREQFDRGKDALEGEEFPEFKGPAYHSVYRRMNAERWKRLDVIGPPHTCRRIRPSARTPTHRSDVFSFGIVLYEVLCGRGPFTGASASRVIASVVNDSPVPPRRLNSSVPDALERMR